MYDAVCKAAKTNEVINFGCFIDEREEYSYIDIALEIGLLISSGAIDLNLAYTLDALFSEPFGTGYPRKDAKRKQRDTAVLKEINSLSKISMVELAGRLDRDLLKKALQRKNVTEYILRCGTNEELLEAIKRIEF